MEFPEIKKFYKSRIFRWLSSPTSDTEYVSKRIKIMTSEILGLSYPLQQKAKKWKNLNAHQQMNKHSNVVYTCNGIMLYFKFYTCDSMDELWGHYNK